MNTFLPYKSFVLSAKCLDWKRLGKQRVEASQIYWTLILNKKSWSSHPAVIMWGGYEKALAMYHDEMIIEWINRGYKNNMIFLSKHCSDSKMPPWLGMEDFHSSHRSNLIRKDPIWYGKFGWVEDPNLPYWWPSKELK